MSDYDNTNRGALFKNNRKEKDSHPDYNGSLNVGGHDYWISAWLKTDKNGGKFMSLSVKQKDGTEARAEAPKTGAKQQSFARDLDSEVPF